MDNKLDGLIRRFPELTPASLVGFSRLYRSLSQDNQEGLDTYLTVVFNDKLAPREEVLADELEASLNNKVVIQKYLQHVAYFNQNLEFFSRDEGQINIFERFVDRDCVDENLRQAQQHMIALRIVGEQEWQRIDDAVAKDPRLLKRLLELRDSALEQAKTDPDTRSM